MRVEEHSAEYLQADAEGRAKLLGKIYNLPRSAFWKHQQSGKWIISHAGVQSIAAQESIFVDYDIMDPMSIDFVVIKAIPHTRREEGSECNGDWQFRREYGQETFGEASPKNNKMGYPVAMAEKRAFGRAVLITVLGAVGGYGADFYSEEEADDFKRGSAASADPAPQPVPVDMPVEVDTDLGLCQTQRDVAATVDKWRVEADAGGWFAALKKAAGARFRELPGGE